jgi:hypothetical protein
MGNDQAIIAVVYLKAARHRESASVPSCMTERRCGTGRPPCRAPPRFSRPAQSVKSRIGAGYAHHAKTREIGGRLTNASYLAVPRTFLPYQNNSPDRSCHSTLPAAYSSTRQVVRSTEPVVQNIEPRVRCMNKLVVEHKSRREMSSKLEAKDSRQEAACRSTLGYRSRPDNKPPRA